MADMSHPVYLVLFRGVGGQTQLPTAPLRAALTEAGFRNVRTYIATGNAVLATSKSAEAVRHEVSAIAFKRFGFAKEIMVVSRDEWAELINANPFPEAVDRPTTLHAFVLAAAPAPDAIAALTARAGQTERIAVRGKVLYFHAPDGFSRSKLPPLVDKTLKVASTARNWNTVTKLGALADAVALADAAGRQG